MMCFEGRRHASAIMTGEKKNTFIHLHFTCYRNTWSKVSSTHLAALKAPTPPAVEPASTTFASAGAVLSTALSVSLGKKTTKQQRVSKNDLLFTACYFGANGSKITRLHEPFLRKCM